MSGGHILKTKTIFQNKRKIKIICIIIVVLILISTSFVKINNELKFRYSTSVFLRSCDDNTIKGINKLIFLRKLNIQSLETDNIHQVNGKHLKELIIFTHTNHDAYVNINGFDNLNYFRSVGLDFKDLTYFSNMTKLTDLNLGLLYENRIQSSYGFESLPISIESLALNGLENTSKLDTSHLTNLKHLCLTNSSLTTLSINNDKLEFLNVDHNNTLSSIYISKNTSNLSTLTICDCPNLKITINDLLSISSLKTVWFTNGMFSEDEISELENNGIEVEISKSENYNSETDLVSENSDVSDT